MKLNKLLAWVLLVVLALMPTAMAEMAELEAWEHEELEYVEMTISAGDAFTATGFILVQERGNFTYPGHDSTEMVCFFYPDQPLELNVRWEADQISAVMPEKLHITSAFEDLGVYSGSRATITGQFAYSDEANCYATVVALENVTVVAEDAAAPADVFEMDQIGQIGEITQVAPAQLPDWAHVSSDSNAAYVTSDGGDSNIRKQPNLQGSVVKVLKKGERATYLGKNSWDERGVEWYNISYNGVKGWVSSKYTTLSGATVSAYVYADGGDSNMRKEPNLQGKIYCTFKEGNYAVYLNRDSVDDRGVTWYYVAYGNYTGWVSSRYTSLIYTGGNNTVTATGNVFVRLGPGLGYGICDVMAPGEVRAYKGNTYHDDRGIAWYRVECKNGAGWVSSRYTKLGR